MTTPNADLQNLSQTSGFIELFQLDCTPIGGPIYYFTTSVSSDGSPLLFGGNSYSPMPIATTGWDFTSAGTSPKPTITISNVAKTLMASVVTLGDIVGAKVIRIRTYAKYLDNGSSPDSTKYLGPDTYVVEMKTMHDNTQISWQLSSIIDRMGLMLPRRQVLKDKGFPGVGRTRIK